MPTTYSDQFYIIDPANPPARGTPLSFVRYDLTDQNDDGDIDQFDGDSIDGVDVTASWPGDTITIRVPGVGRITYTGTTFYLADGRSVFTPTDGQVLVDGIFQRARDVSTQGPLNVPGDLGPTCFVAGTLIETPSGPRRIDDLCRGDLVLSRDHGPQPIRWIGREEIDGSGAFAPIHFEAGSIGNRAAVTVSPNHRMLVTGWQAELFCGEDEVLVAAKQMVNGITVRVAPQPRVTYMHLLFDDHEIIQSHGVWSESFYPAALADHTDRSSLREIMTLFPAIARLTPGHCHLARPMAKPFEAGLMAA